MLTNTDRVDINSAERVQITFVFKYRLHWVWGKCSSMEQRVKQFYKNLNVKDLNAYNYHYLLNVTYSCNNYQKNYCYSSKISHNQKLLNRAATLNVKVLYIFYPEDS